MKKYVMGFLFNKSIDQILLLLQRGHYRGDVVGGPLPALQGSPYRAILQLSNEQGVNNDSIQWRSFGRIATPFYEVDLYYAVAGSDCLREEDGGPVHPTPELVPISVYLEDLEQEHGLSLRPMRKQLITMAAQVANLAVHGEERRNLLLRVNDASEFDQLWMDA